MIETALTVDPQSLFSPSATLYNRVKERTRNNRLNLFEASQESSAKLVSSSEAEENDSSLPCSVFSGDAEDDEAEKLEVMMAKENCFDSTCDVMRQNHSNKERTSASGIKKVVIADMVHSMVPWNEEYNDAFESSFSVGCGEDFNGRHVLGTEANIKTESMGLRKRRLYSIDLDATSMHLDDETMMNLTPSLSFGNVTISKLPPLADVDSSTDELPSNIVPLQCCSSEVPDSSTNMKNSKCLNTKNNAVFLEYQRDRGLSLDFLAFDLGDEHLLSSPLEEHQEVRDYVTGKPPGRPRGDSIIFDPCSFNEGGIHEENALLKASRQNSSSDALELLLEEDEVAIMNSPGFHSTTAHLPPMPKEPMDSYVKKDNLPASKQILQIHTSIPRKSTHCHSGSMSSIFSPQSTVAGVNCQMDLLNTGGRIGIYLPEERKARIARFHSKRKMRIWRKRIKYDCRKKLADSRPRIKGRFVKRSDMGTNVVVL